MMNLNNNKILVTGGASGIGLGLTGRLIKEKNTVIICGRRKDILEEAAKQFPSVITRVSDLSTAEGRQQLYDWIAAEHSDLDMLINNAGIQNWMSLEDNDFFQRATNEIAVNIEAPIHLCSLFIQLKSLKAIANVTSGLAFVPFAKVPVYSATKAFLRSFTLSLRYLLQPKNIEVIEIIPPALNTDLGGTGLHNAAPPVSDFIESIFEQWAQGKNELTFGTTESRSKAGQEELMKYFKMMNV